jgi:hypothetical protein
MGKPFSGWLTMVLSRTALDIVPRPPINESLDELEDLPGPPPKERDVFVAEKMRRCLARLSDKCQLYLPLFADGYKPREIVLMLRLPKEEGKKVADAIRHCLGRLEIVLRDEGIGPDEDAT